jgi:hypothetical protein
MSSGSVTEETPTFQPYLESHSSQEDEHPSPSLDENHIFPSEHYTHEDEIHNTVRDIINSLSQRGTGRHMCPYGAACSKGGFKDGQYVVFERNSAFR